MLFRFIKYQMLHRIWSSSDQMVRLGWQMKWTSKKHYRAQNRFDDNVHFETRKCTVFLARDSKFNGNMFFRRLHLIVMSISFHLSSILRMFMPRLTMVPAIDSSAISFCAYGRSFTNFIVNGQRLNATPQSSLLLLSSPIRWYVYVDFVVAQPLAVGNSSLF